MREPAIVMMMLVLVQFLLGALTVWTGKGVQIATAHVATGALLFGTCAFIAARSFHLYALPDAEREFSVSPQPSRT
jgi:heme A synthase